MRCFPLLVAFIVLLGCSRASDKARATRNEDVAMKETASGDSATPLDKPASDEMAPVDIMMPPPVLEEAREPVLVEAYAPEPEYQVAEAPGAAAAWALG